MAADTHLLGIDFGTSNTAAVLRWPDGRVRPLLFDGSPLLPSAVVLDGGGALLAGREALNGARAWPGSFEPNPKRRIDDGVVLLGDREMSVVDLIAAVLGRVADEARRVVSGQLCTVLTHPASWAAPRREVLVAAARQAGLGEPRLVAEPVAAASYFVDVHGERLPVGATALVYDFGAGTFDASVVLRTESGYDVLASEGLPDAGGLDIDAAVIAYLGAVYAPRYEAQWRRIEKPGSAVERRARWLLWEDVRLAKETLSRSASAWLVVPLLDEEAPLGREQLERLARPIVERTVAATLGTLRTAGVRPADLAGLFLVGGSSRMPLAATLLHAALRVAPTALEQPELVVAEGSVTVPPDPIARTVAVASPILAEPVTAGLAGTTLGPVPAPISPASAPGSPAVPAPVAAAPGVTDSTPDPPFDPVHSGRTTLPAPDVADGPPEGRRAAGRAVRPLAALVAVGVALVLAATGDQGPTVLTAGLVAPFALPQVALLPAVLLTLLTGGRLGAGILRPADGSPWRAAVRFGLRYAAGYGLGIALGFVLSAPLKPDDDNTQWFIAECVLAALGGAGLTAWGLWRVAVAARQPDNADRIRPATAGAPRRRRPPAQWIGLGLGLATLASASSYDYAYQTYDKLIAHDDPLSNISRVPGFVLATGAAVALCGLILATLGARRPQWTPGPGTDRTLAVLTGVAYVLGGIWALYTAKTGFPD